MKRILYPGWIGKWLKSMDKAMGAMDEATWAPFDIFQFEPYFADLAAERMAKAAKRAEERRADFNVLASKLNSPQVSRAELYLAAADLKASGLYRTKVGPQIFELYNKLLHAQCQKDYYGKNSSYVHSDLELHEIIGNTPWENGTLEQGREIGRLINSLSELSWSLYSDYFYPNSYRNLGPYSIKLDGKKTLIIREYTDCKPVEIWKEAKNNPAKHVKILTVYNPSAGIGMDWIEHIYSRKSLPQNLTHFAVWADGKWLTMEQTTELRHKFEEKAGEQFERFSNLEFEEVKKKFVTLRYFELREMYNELGIDWKPSKEMLERIEGKPLLKPQYPKNMSNKDWHAFWHKFFDPRNDFWPEGWKTENAVG